MEAIPRTVCLIGPESTGKSELAASLARHYDALATTEFARSYALEHARDLTFDDVEPIARGQMELEDAGRAAARRVLILDTDLISTVVYSHHYYGRCPSSIEEAALRRRADLYLLMDVDVPWVPDAARDRGDRRAELFNAFRETLARFGARFVVLSGGWAERREKAIAAIG